MSSSLTCGLSIRCASLAQSAAQPLRKRKVQGARPWRSPTLAGSFNGRTPFLHNGCLRVRILLRLPFFFEAFQVGRGKQRPNTMDLRG